MADLTPNPPPAPDDLPPLLDPTANPPDHHRLALPPTARPLDRPGRSERGQATAEYALVMLAAAAIAGLLLAWAASTDGIGRLLDAVMQSIIDDAG